MTETDHAEPADYGLSEGRVIVDAYGLPDEDDVMGWNEQNGYVDGADPVDPDSDAGPFADVDVWAIARRMTDWLDDNTRINWGIGMLLRCLKVGEEAGEVTAAVIGVTGQNPRKGFSHTWDDVAAELCDVILTAMVALTTIKDEPADVFGEHITRVALRAELPAPVGFDVPGVVHDLDGTGSGQCASDCSGCEYEQGIRAKLARGETLTDRDLF